MRKPVSGYLGGPGEKRERKKRGRVHNRSEKKGWGGYHR